MDCSSTSCTARCDCLLQSWRPFKLKAASGIYWQKRDSRTLRLNRESLLWRAHANRFWAIDHVDSRESRRFIRFVVYYENAAKEAIVALERIECGRRLARPLYFLCRRKGGLGRSDRGFRSVLPRRRTPWAIRPNHDCGSTHHGARAHRTGRRRAPYCRLSF